MGKIIREFKEVTWPTGRQLRRDTTIVVLTIIIVSLFLGVVDELVTMLFNWYIQL